MVACATAGYTIHSRFAVGEQSLEGNGRGNCRADTMQRQVTVHDDYILSPEVCVERKTLADLRQSFLSGRLYHQVPPSEASCTAACRFSRAVHASRHLCKPV